MHALAYHQSDVAVLTLSWINEQLRQEIARLEEENSCDGWHFLAVPRPALMALAGGLCGIGLLLARMYV